MCTHILYAFASIDESNFTIVPFDENDVSNEWSKIGMYERVNRLKKIDPQLKTLISIGGWSFGTKIFQQTSSNETNRSKFISSAIDFVRFHNFDGIDIDWEYPNGTEDINSFTLLMKELRRAISMECLDTTRKDRLLLTVAVSASRKTIKTGYNIPELAKYVTQKYLPDIKIVTET
ncbi:unnamed protein product [Anisakis simplex]|uniref:GH18 domain-containing protein n=1 Tax=Anisakis simplex TaxID=6269 RepID=A0A3P6RX15_ANISI|nr:unnamed protein product [Anisakis simplex]